MKFISALALLAFASCNTGESKPGEKTNYDTVAVEKKKVDTKNIKPDSADIATKPGVFSNERFKEVRVKKMAGDKFEVSGKAQIFESQFGWVVEDGHEELKTGSAMTDAGAPEWGNFNFIVEAPKKKANSVLHLILFESSPKDGSRQV
jgi:hypothetical protein